MIEPRLLKGFRDYGPAEQSVRQAMFNTISQTFERFGFLPLSTPVLEYQDILLGKYGEDEKLVYTFTDHGDRQVAMRYDLTVPLARYVAQNQGQLTLPFKRYHIAPVWRADNPQKGRLREFYQCDIDVVGSDSVLADADVIAGLAAALDAVGVSGYLIRLNDRRLFSLFAEQYSLSADQTASLIRAIDKVDKIGVSGVTDILSGAGFAAEVITATKTWLEAGQGSNALATLKNLLTSADAAPVFANIEKLLATLVLLGVAEQSVVFDPSIARGLDYYTSTVFEVVLPNQMEYGSICSGGRYDNLLDTFSKTPLPAVGGAIGIDRLLDAVTAAGNMPSGAHSQVLLVNFNDAPELQTHYLELITQLRQAGLRAELYYEPVKLDKQLKYAEQKNIDFAVIVGPDELSQKMTQVKHLATREQVTVPANELPQWLENKLDHHAE
jgi:histidyl-tRNA synthetase